MIATKIIAACAYSARAGALFGLSIWGLVGCGTLQAPPRPQVYDFGPGLATTVAAQPPAPLPTRGALVLADVDAPASLDSSAVLYRLSYSDAQQLRPYAHARWSMPPAQLLRQRLRETLGQQRVLLLPGEGLPAPVPGTPTTILRISLEEFSQIFTAPDASAALVRLRATLSQSGPGGERVVAQRSFVVQRDSASADAVGGVRALTAAADGAIAELDRWLLQGR